MFKDKRYYIEKTKEFLGLFASALVFDALVLWIILW